MIRLTEDNYSRIFVPGDLQIDLDRSNETAVWTFHTNYTFAGGLGESKLSSYLEQTPPEHRQAVFDSLNYIVMPPVING